MRIGVHYSIMRIVLGLALLFSLLANPIAVYAQAVSVDSCKKFVQDFYDWYETYPKHVDYGNAYSFRPHSFSNTLASLLKQDAAANAQGDGISGLDADPFFATNGGGDNDRFFVTSAHIRQGHCFAGVHVVPEYPDIKGDILTAELQAVKGQWQFVNLHYPARGNLPEDDLITNLKVLREERIKPATK
jgi:hypothetical protein